MHDHLRQGWQCGIKQHLVATLVTAALHAHISKNPIMCEKQPFVCVKQKRNKSRSMSIFLSSLTRTLRQSFTTGGLEYYLEGQNMLRNSMRL